ncbi:MAG: hypothetical protein ACRCSN_16350, partial [Dermatophilaceae bacterium]
IWDVYDDDLSAPWVVPAILACVAVTLVSLAVTRAGSRSPTNFTVVSRVAAVAGCVLIALQIWDAYDDDFSTPWVLPAILVCVAATLFGSRSRRE